MICYLLQHQRNSDRTQLPQRESHQRRQTGSTGRVCLRSNSSKQWPTISLRAAAMEELIDASTAERAQLLKISPDGKAGRGSCLKNSMRRLPQERRKSKIRLLRKIDVFAAIKANGALAAIRDIIRPRREAVNIPAKLWVMERELPLHTSPSSLRNWAELRGLLKTQLAEGRPRLKEVGSAERARRRLDF